MHDGAGSGVLQRSVLRLDVEDGDLAPGRRITDGVDLDRGHVLARDRRRSLGFRPARAAFGDARSGLLTDCELRSALGGTAGDCRGDRARNQACTENLTLT
jgi:hypothetical protein